jgi:hypothetical protein
MLLVAALVTREGVREDRESKQVRFIPGTYERR